MEKTIGEQIKQGRLAKGETQFITAAKLSVSQQIISGWERGRRKVATRYRKRLTKEYGVQFEPVPVKPERRATPDRRQPDITPIEEQFIGELRGLLEAVKGMLFNGVRVRRGRIIRRART